MKLSKIAVGWYANEDGTFAVIGDAPGDIPTKTEVERDEQTGGINVGMNTQREWQVLHDPAGRLREEMGAGNVLAWTETLRSAREYLNAREAAWKF